MISRTPSVCFIRNPDQNNTNTLITHQQTTAERVDDDTPMLQQQYVPTATAKATQHFKSFALEILRAVARGHLHPSAAPKAITLAGISHQNSRIDLDLADTLWFVWLEITSTETDQQKSDSGKHDPKSCIADAAKHLVHSAFVTKRSLMEISEGEFMEWAGFVVNYKEGWRKKEIRSNTRNIYTQRKFNLLREESEGYSKMVTLLNQSGAGVLTAECFDATLKEIKALIGYFDLDPNRVCSLILDSFTVQPHNDTYIQLLTSVNTNALSQLLGFHFSRQPTPPSGLYIVASKLIQRKHVQLEALLAHVSPKEEQFAAEYKQGMTEMSKAVKNIGVISLNQAVGGDGQQATAAAAGTKTMPPPPPNAQPSGDQNKRRYSQTASTIELDATVYAQHLVGQNDGADNQRIALLAALFSINAWEDAMMFCRWLAIMGIQDVAMYPNVGRALCTLLAKEILPLYETMYPGGMRSSIQIASQTTVIEEQGNASASKMIVTQRAHDILGLIGYNLYHDISVLTRLLRLLGAALKSNNNTTTAVSSSITTETVLSMLSAHILPAVALVPCNTPLVLELWDVLCLLPYHERFALYGDLKKASASSLLLTASAKLAETEIRRILRRVTAPTNKREGKMAMRPLGRMLAKIAHANPMAVSEQLLRQVMGMPGMVVSIAESLKFLTPVAFDVLTFAIVRQLASSKRKLKDDGINLEEWFQWLAAFIGIVSRKHDPIEVTAIAQYVANQLKSSESLDLLVLWELVSCMTGIAPVFDISDSQLDALAGSETLLAQVVSSQQTDGGGGAGSGGKGYNERAVQRNTQRLLRLLSVGPKEQQLALPLLLLLAQQRKLITLNPPSSHLKLVAELYDKCQEATVQYAEFLRRALSPAEYADLMPSITDLAVEYRIDPEIIFELHRPMIKGIIPPVKGGKVIIDLKDLGVGDSSSNKVGDAKSISGGSVGALTAEPGETTTPAAKGVGLDDDGDDEEGEIADDGEEMRITSSEPTQREKNLDDKISTDFEDGEVPDNEDKEDEGRSGGPDGDGGVLVRHGGKGLDGRVTGVLSLSSRPVIEIVSNDEAWQSLVNHTHVLAPEGGFLGMSQSLFVTFWSLSLYDVDVPSTRYQSVIAQVNSMVRALRDDINAARRDVQRGFSAASVYGGHHFHHQPPPPPSSQSVADVDALMREAEKLDGMALKLPEELKEQKENALFVDARLKATCDSWVVEDTVTAQAAAAREFVQFCILPRVLNSPSDALYCARFLHKIHVLGPPGFRFLTVIDKIFKELGYLVRCCTAREATNLGIFFAHIISMVALWREAKIYAAECSQSEAFKSYKSVGADTSSTASVAPDSSTMTTAVPPAKALLSVSHTEFLHLTANWHKKLTLDVFCTCLSSADYMQMKNALLVLNRMVRVYPATREDSKELLKVLSPIRDKDPREDLKTLARMYCTALEMAMRDKNRLLADTRNEFAGRGKPKRKAAAAGAGAGADVNTKERAKKKKEDLETRKQEKKDDSDDRRKGRNASAQTAAVTPSTDTKRSQKDKDRDAAGPPKSAGRDRDRDRNRDSDRKRHTAAHPRVDALEFKPSAGGGTSNAGRRDDDRKSRSTAAHLRADAPEFKPSTMAGGGGGTIGIGANNVGRRDDDRKRPYHSADGESHKQEQQGRDGADAKNVERESKRHRKSDAGDGAGDNSKQRNRHDSSRDDTLKEQGRDQQHSTQKREPAKDRRHSRDKGKEPKEREPKEREPKEREPKEREPKERELRDKHMVDTKQSEKDSREQSRKHRRDTDEQQRDRSDEERERKRQKRDAGSAAHGGNASNNTGGGTGSAVKKMERDSRLPASSPAGIPPISVSDRQTQEGDGRQENRNRRRRDGRRNGGGNRHHRR